MLFKEGEIERPHPDTEKRLADRNNKYATPYSNIKLFCLGREVTTKERIASKEFEEIMDKVIIAGKIDSIEDFDVLINKVAKLEKSCYKKLEFLAKKIIQKEFGLSDDVMENIEGRVLGMSKESMECIAEDFEIDENGNIEKVKLTEEEKKILPKEIEIRKIINSMIMGGGYKLFEVLKEFKEEIDEINPELYYLYNKINANSGLIIWKMHPYSLFERAPVGSVKLKVKEDNDIKISKVEAVACNFPVLLHELAKGAMEYLFAIRLSGFSENLRKSITDEADSYEDEHFHKLLGPQIWKQIFYGIEIALDEYLEQNTLFDIENKREMLPLIINKIATLDAKNFIELINDMLNPGEAIKNKRQIPLERIKIMIHSINMDIKNFLEYQLDVNQNSAQVIEDRDDCVEKNYSTMSKKELSNELSEALAEENFELAIKLRDLINKK